MGIQPIQSMRISTTMQTQMLLEQMRVNTLRMFDDQQQLATGRRLLVPSQDAAGASRALNISAVLSHQQQLQRNTAFADRFAAATEAALTGVRDIFNEAATLASQNVGVPADADQRAAAAAVVEGLISQLVSIANRQHEGIYLFAGQACDKPPFEEGSGGVVYKGDANPLSVNIDDVAPTRISLTGEQVFGAVSGQIKGWSALTPRVDASMRLADLQGAYRQGIRPGQVTIEEVGGAGVFTVDLTGAATLGDVTAAINAAAAAAGATITASLTTNGIRLDVDPAFDLSVSETGNGTTASDLGIERPAPGGALVGKFLLPRLTLSTPLSWLRMGMGIDQAGGLRLRNDNQTVTVDISTAQTVQDVINAINAAGIGAVASINAMNNGLNVQCRVSGSSLSIGEQSGTTATDLGIRSLHSGRKLADLNNGSGVGTVTGADIRIVARTGATVDVDLSGAKTVGDVLAAINAATGAAGVAVTADLTSTGNSIELVDATGGAGWIRVERMNFSPALEDLGLDVEGSPTNLVSRDVSAARPEGAFAVLQDLRRALDASDTAGITAAGERLKRLQQNTGAVQGQAAALGRLVAARQDRLEDAVLTSQSLLSDIQDADYTEVITRFTQAQTVMQATLMTGSRLMQMSLLDFLR